MTPNCFEGSILINAELSQIGEVLSQHEFISQWEKGHATFKELNVSADKKTIIHWDIENDIDYVYKLMKKNDCTLVHLQINKPCLVCSAQGAGARPSYISSVLPQIKRVCEIKNNTQGRLPNLQEFA